MIRQSLSRQEVINAIERKGGTKIPLVFHKWWGNGLEDKYGDKLNEMASKYPDDIFRVFYNAPGESKSTTNTPSYRWGYKEDYTGVAKHSIGEVTELLSDWSELDIFLKDLPNPNEHTSFDNVKNEIESAGNRYKLGCFWKLFHERLWSIRGMENLMMDYYDDMDGLKLICRHLLDFYKVIIDRFAELGFDGIFTSDDLGHQTNLMMSPAIFEELYFPFYKEFIEYVHEKRMHVFLHSCGDNTKIMHYLIEAGLDVFHPIQKGCMDEAETVANFGDKITFLAGVDVQHLLPEGTVQEVKAGVTQLIDTLYKKEGGLLLAAGNGILSDTPLENIEAMLETISSGKLL